MAGLAVAVATGTAAGCSPLPGANREGVVPAYLGAETTALKDGLVEVALKMRDPGGVAALDEYGRCAVARHALDTGFGFARHLRTRIGREQGGVWTADAVYMMTRTFPRGVSRVDARQEIKDCAARGVPTV
ncbi:hypothetical protein [Rhodovulum kholense]|uniref:Lipoprotein n=1 Tax=Rhodovulum kholense TaxID=453584 RepID=A0A8E2VI64_9RHOB|nr:hypothetical protein [Rhodovulum kholense]PTW47137.1 hypothetical protein C8N38_110106 [Rhodovulum kholense]